MIRVPENWPLAWWGSDGAQIKMSCPSCGAFAMLLTRNIPDGSLRSLACEGCGLSGVKPVQDAFDGWVAAHAQARAQDQADHAGLKTGAGPLGVGPKRGMGESHGLTVVKRQKQRGFRGTGRAVSFHETIDMLMPATTFMLFWVDGVGYWLIVGGEPLLNNRALVELIWGIRTAGTKFAVRETTSIASQILSM